MILAAWIAINAIVCIALARRPHAIALLGLAVWIFVPSVAGSVFVGTALDLHPGTWTLIIGTGVLLLTKDWPIKAGVNKNLGTLAAMVGFVVLGTVVTAGLRSAYATSGFLNTFLSATLIFLIIRTAMANQSDAGRKIAVGFVGIALLQTALAFAQFATGDVLNFSEQRAAFYWFRDDALVRSMGTLDSPLDLAMLLVVAIPLCAQIRRVPLRALAAITLTVGVALTQSRAGAALAVAGLIYLVLRSSMRLGQRALVAVAIGVALGYLTFAPNTITAGLFDRYEGSVASTQAREFATGVFLQEIWEHSPVGTGFGSSGVFRELGIINTSLENGYFMFAWDFGVVGLLTLGLTVFVAFVRGIRGGAIRGSVAALALGLVAAAGYSGIATQSAALVILFAALALAAPASRCYAEAPSPSVAAAIETNREAVRR